MLVLDKKGDNNMEEFIRGKLLKDKGECVGNSGVFIKHYDGQNEQVDPWLDGVLINFYKWLRNSKLIIMELQLYGIWNDMTKLAFKYPVPYTVQVVLPLNGLTHKAFFEKYSQDEKFLDKYMIDCLQPIIEENKEDIEEYRRRAKLMANN